MSSVSVNTVSQLPTQQTLYSSTQTEDGAYVQSWIDINYMTDLHTLAMPVASSAITKCSMAVVAQPTMKKVVTYTIEKSGAQPTMPQSISTDPNEILLDRQIMPAVLDVEADGASKNWKVVGKYIYQVIDPSQVKIYAGRQPYLNVPFTDTLISDSQFVPGLTCPESPSLSGYTGLL